MHPSGIAKKTFALVQRGYDPQQVGQFLEQLAAHVTKQEHALSEAIVRIDKLNGDLYQARSAEEAVKLSLVAASQAKEEMIAAARAEIAEMQAAAAAKIAAAEEAAEKLRDDARREAIQIIRETQHEADQAAAKSGAEAEHLERRIVELRQAVRTIEQQLRSATTGARDVLAAIESPELAEPSREPIGVEHTGAAEPDPQSLRSMPAPRRPAAVAAVAAAPPVRSNRPFVEPEPSMPDEAQPPADESADDLRAQWDDDKLAGIDQATRDLFMNQLRHLTS